MDDVRREFGAETFKMCKNFTDNLKAKLKTSTPVAQHHVPARQPPSPFSVDEDDEQYEVEVCELIATNNNGNNNHDNARNKELNQVSP